MVAQAQNKFLRHASPNEQRTISREDLGFYNAVIISAVYDFGDGFDTTTAQSFFEPIRQCIEAHPFLCVVVGDRHTDKGYFERVPKIHLPDHITILDSVSKEGDGLAAIEEVMAGELNVPFAGGIPPWRIVVLPLGGSQALVVFSFSHTIGDGPTGVSFHRSLLKAVREASKIAPETVHPTVTTPETPLPAPFDTPEHLPISWSFLLAPLLGNILPGFIAKLFGFKAQASTVDAGTWLGTRTMFFDPATNTNKLKLREMPASAVTKAIHAARAHDAKLSGTLARLLARGVGRAVGDNAGVTNYVVETAINMRRSVGVHEDEMGEFASGCYLAVPHVAACEPGTPLSEAEWEGAREATRKLALSAAQLQDQPIGLLRYVSSVRKWLADKVGSERGSSFEMSNIGLFDPDRDGGAASGGARIVKAIFAQPGHVTSSAIAFNIITLKGGALAYTVTWQVGALGIPEDEEEAFITRVCDGIDADFAAL
ncbi:hypothetical protein F5X68DRAFT_204292 [Plectosphaerella plurivora]|uniref:Alcohol acetyltransferase n=1 Tax=Plectosphaerella plurivora TaxID=936078 RepID=A0A9P9AC33_9PEZI|nr:hypothetical protein F5X68DRAFT_204292 [Plectosphaerella plurivora]